MARTAPVPNIPAIPGMAPGAWVMAGGAGGGGGGGKGGSGAGGGQGAGTEGGGDGAGGSGGTAPSSDAETVSHPVDVATGRAFTDEAIDLKLPGPLPFKWSRSYSTSASRRDAGLGWGWSHNFAWRIQVRRRSVVLHTEDGITVPFDRLEVGEDVIGPNGWLLVRREDGYALDTGDGIWRLFSDGGANKGRWYALAAITDRNDNRINLHYQDGRLSEIHDCVGRVVRLSLTPEGRIAAVQTKNAAERGRWVEFARYGYDAEGNLVSVTDAAGHCARFAYDEEHRLVTHTDRAGLAFHFVYDAKGRCVESWGDYPGQADPSLADDLPDKLADGISDAKGVHHCKISYDEEYTEALDSQQVRRFFTNEFGTADKVIDGGFVTSYERDSKGFVVAQQDAEGAVTRWTRDDRGRVLALVDPLGRTTLMERDATGGVTELVDPAGGVTTVERDLKGNRVALTRPDGTRTAYIRNDHGQVSEVLFANGGRSTIEYDQQANPISLTSPGGVRWQWTYDYLGRRTSETDPTGATRRYVLDDRGDLLAVHHPNGSTTHYAYDGEGRAVRVTDQNGHATDIVWGGLNRLCARNAANGASVQLRYDREGEVVGIVNEAGETSRFSYDGARRLTERVDFDGTTTRFRYDGCGRRTQLINGAGEIVELVYNAAGELLEEHRPDDTVVAFEYNQRGEVIAGDRPGCSVTFERDALGRIIREQTQIGEQHYWAEIDYDHFGHVVGRRSSEGYREEIERGVDGGRIKTILNDHAIGHQNDPLGREIQRVLASGGNIDSSYNKMGRLERRMVTAPTPGASLSSSEPEWLGPRPANATADTVYSYDPRAELTSVSDGDLGSLAYTYDPVGQLLAAVPEQARGHVFRYDAAGNVYEAGEDAPARQYGPGNRLLRRGETEYVWNDDGQLIEKREPGEAGRPAVWSYSYDGGGMLTTVARPDRTVVSFVYDAFGRRVQKQISAPNAGGQRRTTTTQFVYSVGSLLHEITRKAAESGDPIVEQKSYCFEDSRFIPLAHYSGKHDGDGDWYHYVNDAAGAPLRVVGAGGKVEWTASRDPWGNASHEESNGAATPLRFQGQYADSETGLCHHRARYYDPDTGRFISRDPLGPAGGLHGYRYAPNPVSWVDPHGLVSYTVPGGEPPITDTPGSFTLNGHGNSEAVVTDDGYTTDPKKLAEFIRKQPGYTAGMPVILAACNTGEGSNSIAEQLAEELKAPVSAPDEKLWVFEDGSHTITNSDDGAKSGTANTGNWRTFPAPTP
jgi:RHS repeat-associated protein